MAGEMEIFLGLLAILALLLLTILGYAVYSGLFHSIQVDACTPPFENLMIAYKFAKGPYNQCGALFCETHSLVPHLKCIGVYYDDPKQVLPESLRYLVGVVVGSKELTASSEDQSLLQAKGYKFTTFPAVDHVVMTKFPFRGRLSIAIAVARVYPVLSTYIEEKRLCAHPMLEIYEDNDILFVAPLSKQNEFYVDEASSDYADDISISQEDSAIDDRDEPTLPPLNFGRADGENAESAEHSNGNGNSDKSSVSSFEELNFEK